jgi:hypothetical protein
MVTLISFAYFVECLTGAEANRDRPARRPCAVVVARACRLMVQRYSGQLLDVAEAIEATRAIKMASARGCPSARCWILVDSVSYAMQRRQFGQPTSWSLLYGLLLEQYPAATIMPLGMSSPLDKTAIMQRCSGIIAANGDCLVTESPVIVRCDYDASRRHSRCVGIADRRQIFDADATVAAPRRRREKH